ncbi:MAG: efflux RND transporter periplasmic adaptor subunit [Planctomycetota bacterium]
MKKFFRSLAWIAGVLLAIVVVLGVAGSIVAARFAPGDDQDLEVWLKTVETGELVETLAAPGLVEAVTEVEISARVSARILDIPNGEGKQVTAGDPASDPPIPPSILIELDASDLRAQLDAAQKRRDSLIATTAVDRARIRGLQASRKSALTTLDDARSDLERQARLQESGDVSAMVLEDARQAFASAEAAAASADANLQAAELGLEVTGFNIASSEAEIQRLRENLAYTTITSPIDGIVTRVNVEAGEIAVTGTMNNPGTVLIEVADLSGLVVTARIDESDIIRAKEGQPAKIYIAAYPDQVFDGIVERVALATSTQTAAGRGSTGSAYFETRIRLNELPDPIRTGLSASVEIEAAKYHDVLLVPNQSVMSVPIESLPTVEDGDDDEDGVSATYNVGSRTTALAVYAVRDGKATLVPVEIGASDENNTIITAGLKVGDTVISGPFASLSQLAKDLKVRVTRRDGKAIDAEASSSDTGEDRKSGGNDDDAQ